MNLAEVCTRTRALVCSGLVPANSNAVGPASSSAMIAARSEPTSSWTASSSSAIDSQGAGGRAGGVGRPRASPVEQDQPAEGRQPSEEQADPRVLPAEVDVAIAPADQDQVGRTLAEDLVGDPVSSQPRVLRLGYHGSSGPAGVGEDFVPHGDRAGDDGGGG